MDLLFKRYASPFPFIDGMIQTGRFSEFVDGFLRAVNEEINEKTMWEFFLHRVWEGTFEDFKNGLKIDMQNRNMSERTIETTVKDSMEILKNFKPVQDGGGT